MTSQIVNTFGLILDIFGVVGLFFSRDKGLETISTIGIRLTSTFQSNEISDKIKKEIDDLTNEVNSIIETTNKNNRMIFVKSKKWIVLIIVGFLFQIASIFLPKFI